MSVDVPLKATPSKGDGLDDLRGQVRSILSTSGAQNSGAHEIESLDPLTQSQLASESTDRELKRMYARWFIGILIGQLLLMNAVFLGAGIGCLTFEEWTLRIYMAGTLTEVFAVVFVITKYLFRQK